MPDVDHTAPTASIQANVHMILRHRLACAIRAGLLALAGILVASPYLTTHGVGTGESYNYSLAVADGVTQLRAGVFPVLVGQTPFAFNGRVHPLRNAPYLIYLAGAIDVVTGHRLGFHVLQNFSLAFSLLASFFACYAALRWGVRCPPWPALFLACAYGGSAALLAAAYSLDLFMTVHAAPFVPLALAAVARQMSEPRVRNDFLLGGFLGAAWWAHPPVALWLTVGAGLLRLLLWVARPSWRSLAGLAGAAVFGVLLAGFTFISAFEITHYNSFFNAGTRAETGFVALVLSQARRAFIGSVSPVSRSADELGDFQLGYVCWVLLAGSFVVVRQPAPWRGRRLAGAGLVGVALLMVSLCVQVPYFTAWIWSRLPGVFYLLTNDWPMQRLYLIGTAATLLAAGLLLAPHAESQWRRRPWLGSFLLAAALGWLAWEALPFVTRGQRDRWSRAVTARNYLPSNLDLTVTSYAFLGVPPTFSHGVMEPWMEFRILGDFGRTEIASNYGAALAQSAVTVQGTWQHPGAPGTGTVTYDPPLKLEPGRHYLLDFHWLTPAFPGVIALSGPSLQRVYLLPEAGEKKAFGMRAGQRTALALSTSQTTPETVRLSLLASNQTPRLPVPATLADFKLVAVDDAKLPVRVRSWLPLRADVTAPADECYVETARRFIPGYAAFVNGRPVRPIASATGQLMLPVPAGESQIEVRYEGTPLLLAAFWTSLGTGAAGLLVAGCCLVLPRCRSGYVRTTPPSARRILEGAVIAFAGTVAFGAAVALSVRKPWTGVREVPGTVGPLEVRLLLPKGFSPRQQPIIVSGRKGAGNFVFLKYTDDERLQVGLDLWGYVRLSEPIRTDYNQEQDLVVTGGMLYPLGDPLVHALSPFLQSELRRELKVELNGRTVLVERHPTYESLPREITIGSSGIGGSMVEPRFRGEILEVRRLPVPLSVIRSDHPLRLDLELPPNLAGRNEPLLTAWTSHHTQELFYLTYLAGSRVALGYATTDGTEIDGEPVSAKADRPHSVEWVTQGADLTLKLDGVAALQLPGRGLLPGQVQIAHLGLNDTRLPVANARFTGPELVSTSGLSRRPTVPTAGGGPLRMVAILPAGKTGTTEPLLVTGVAGKGDVVYVKYADASHIQLGFDHWGVGGGLSAPIVIDYASPHQIDISLGSLYPAENEAAPLNLPAAVLVKLRQQVTIRLDGAPAWTCDSPAYPSEPSDILAGKNRIGASSCAEDFSGEILEVDRDQP